MGRGVLGSRGPGPGRGVRDHRGTVFAFKAGGGHSRPVGRSCGRTRKAPRAGGDLLAAPAPTRGARGVRVGTSCHLCSRVTARDPRLFPEAPTRAPTRRRCAWGSGAPRGGGGLSRDGRSDAPPAPGLSGWTPEESTGGIRQEDGPRRAAIPGRGGGGPERETRTPAAHPASEGRRAWPPDLGRPVPRPPPRPRLGRQSPRGPGGRVRSGWGAFRCRVCSGGCAGRARSSGSAALLRPRWALRPGGLGTEAPRPPRAPRHTRAPPPRLLRTPGHVVGPAPRTRTGSGARPRLGRWPLGGRCAGQGPGRWAGRRLRSLHQGCVAGPA